MGNGKYFFDSIKDDSGKVILRDGGHVRIWGSPHWPGLDIIGKIVGISRSEVIIAIDGKSETTALSRRILEQDIRDGEINIAEAEEFIDTRRPD